MVVEVVVAVGKVNCSTVNTADSSKEMAVVVIVVVAVVVVVETGSDLRVVDSKLWKLVEKDITLRKFMFQASKVAYCCLCCILRRGPQNVDSVFSCRSSICC